MAAMNTMPKSIAACVSAGLLSLAVLAGMAGCVSSRVSGRTTEVLTQRITRLGICLQRGVFKESNIAAVVGNQRVHDLFPHLSERLPLKFSANGVESATAPCDAGSPPLPPALDGFAHVLQLTPQSSSVSSRSGSTLVVKAQVFRRVDGTQVWHGEITLRPLGGGSFDGPLADDLADKLLLQLHRDGVIPSPTAVIAAAATSNGVFGSGHRKQVPAATGFAEIRDVDAVPVRPEGKDRYRHYLTLPSPKAIVLTQRGGWHFAWKDPNAMATVLTWCEQTGQGCWLYAVDETVVWSADPARRVGKLEQLNDN